MTREQFIRAQVLAQRLTPHCSMVHPRLQSIRRLRNLSFQNIAKVATTLGVPLSTLFLDLEARAQALAPQASAESNGTQKKRAKRS
ncbi:MAG TPA: hypothetical protein VKR43_15070 [Bryobacteraceae bacterium]|nr:hypothetical protein [Bryobacteraceae bacterium]